MTWREFVRAADGPLAQSTCDRTNDHPMLVKRMPTRKSISSNVGDGGDGDALLKDVRTRPGRTVLVLSRDRD
jgi:hypothetical protein